MFDNRFALCFSADAILVTSNAETLGQGPRTYVLATTDSQGQPASVSALRARVAEFLNHSTRNGNVSYVLDPESFTSLGHQRATLIRFFEEMGPMPMNVTLLPPSHS